MATSFDRAWDETDPASTDQAKYGAQEIRELKTDVSQRMMVLTNQADSGWDDRGYTMGVASYKSDSAITVSDVYVDLIDVDYKVTSECDLLWEYSGVVINATDAVAGGTLRFNCGGAEGAISFAVPATATLCLQIRQVEKTVAAANYTLKAEAGLLVGGPVTANYHCISVTPIISDVVT